MIPHGGTRLVSLIHVTVDGAPEDTSTFSWVSQRHGIGGEARHSSRPLRICVLLHSVHPQVKFARPAAHDALRRLDIEIIWLAEENITASLEAQVHNCLVQAWA